MFRMKKSKKPPIRRRINATAQDDDDDDEDDNEQQDSTTMIRSVSAQQRSKSKMMRNANRNVNNSSTTTAGSGSIVSSSREKTSKTRGAVVPPSLGTLEEEEQEQEETPQEAMKSSSSNKKSSKRRRMGYGGGGGGGGMTASSHEEQEEEASATATSGCYDRETLSKLKSEQKSLDDRRQLQAEAADAEKKKKNPELFLHPEDDKSASTSGTGEQQQQQQQRLKKTQGSLNTTASPGAGTSRIGGGSGQYYTGSAMQEDDFIPMHPSNPKPNTSVASPTMILTGDDAFRMAQQQQQQQQGRQGQELQYDPHHQSTSPSEPAAAFASDWEAQVTRRAGLTNTAVTARSAAAMDSSSSNTMAASAAAAASGRGSSQQQQQNLSLMDLRHQFASTRTKLAQQARDLDRLRERRLTESESVTLEYQQRQERVQQAGQALEFYQQWRHALVAWVGALREMQQKLPVLQEAFDDLERDVSALEAWKDWEDDVIFELWQAGRLDQVLGRQPDQALFTTTISTRDEFGRNVKSQQVMAREKRARHRKHIQQQRAAQRLQLRGTNNTSNVLMSAGGGLGGGLADEHAHTSDEELEVLRERHVALQKALAIALEQVDAEYTSLQNLVDLFAQWQHAYPQEYQACYASLTLADLASVLVSAEMIGSLNDPWNESCGYNEAKWTAVIHDASTPKSTRQPSTSTDANSSVNTLVAPTPTANTGGVVFDEAGIERLVEKAVIPAIYNLLRKSGYNLVSERQTRSLTNFLWYVQKILVPRHHDSALLATSNIDHSTTTTTPASSTPIATARVAVASGFNDDGSSNQSRHHHYGRGSQVNSIVGGSSSSRNGKSPAMKSLRKCVIAYIRQFLDGIAIPIVGNSATAKKTQGAEQEEAPTQNQKQQLENALRAARVGQLHRIRTIIIHLLKYWAPLLGADDGFAEAVLYFCSTKLLLFLSSLSGLENEEASAGSSSSSSLQTQALGFVLWSPSDVFRQIWELLQTQEGWMDRPEWMVQTLALRAAAEAYGVTNTS